MLKNLPVNAGDIRDLGSIPGLGRSPLEEEMATYFIILAWEISRTEEPGRVQSMRVADSWRSLSDFHIFPEDGRPICCYETHIVFVFK